jgi:aspartyl-tRNA(Asn)/glutamyl-tRNA(Gln) amidotransferase subunit C
LWNEREKGSNQLLTPEEVRHVAMLARLGLSDEEVESMRVQLSHVLEHIAMLERVDVSAIPPTAQILTHLNVARPDESRPSWPTDDLLATAPTAEDSFFRVPAVFDTEDRGAEPPESGEE